MEGQINKKILNAAKWSTITEIVAKLIVPITNMVLARILSPKAFGVVATITMITSFADMFTDAGFQKYLVQHEFKSEEEKNIFTNVAFWSNFIISILLWILIIIFSEELAKSVGNPGLGMVISIACIQLPLTSFSSIQMSIYRRDFDFKTLFLVRVIGICVPVIITIPLAMLGYNYWSIIIGNIVGNFLNAVILTIKSKWKPKYVYSFSVLKEMLSFSMWSLVESISIWLTTWVDTFIIGGVLSSYYLGLYKTSLTTVNGIFGLITASTTPILFSALSRVQDDNKEFNRIFFSMQKVIAYIVIPIAIGIFIYSDVVVKILLGNKWLQVDWLIGIWGLTSGLVIVLGHYSSEVFRAKGKPKLSFIAQVLHLVVLIPTCIIASKYGFFTLATARAIVRLEAILVNLILIHFIIGISIKNIFTNIKIPLICSIIMGGVGWMICNIYNSLIWGLISIFICMCIYIILLLCIPESRSDINMIFNMFKISDKIKRLKTKIRRKKYERKSINNRI